ncbi:MAG: rhodanese-like domain-containing protein [Verrucomicrobiota bacterium]
MQRTQFCPDSASGTSYQACPKSPDKVFHSPGFGDRLWFGAASRRTGTLRACLAWAICLALAPDARATTAAHLREELAAGAKVVLIDVRIPTAFAQGHLPGAINIPASLCSQKRLPPLGRVVVYDDGLGRQNSESLQAAAAALAQKPGITVDILEGGFAAWESAHGLTTRGRGIHHETLNYITYAQLKANKASDVVLVDLRKKTPAPPSSSSPQALAAAPEPLTDLGREFPGMTLAKSAADQALNSGGDARPLIVLIDSADGSAEAAARLLKAGGSRRYAILAGGELSLARKGQAGLQRSGLRSNPRSGN